MSVNNPQFINSDLLVDPALLTLSRLATASKPIKVIYFLDPICSSCWCFMPQLRKLISEYSHLVETDFRMGGMVKDWSEPVDGFDDPRQVAAHWDKMSAYHGMPIDGNLWLEDPVMTSYPPSIAFKAAQLQETLKATLFLRYLREMVFMEKKNISRWEYIEEAAARSKLDINQLRKDYDGVASVLFEEDLKMVSELNIRGFPTLLIYVNGQLIANLYGVRSWKELEDIVIAAFPSAKKGKQEKLGKYWESIFECFDSLTVKEYAVLKNISSQQACEDLDMLAKEGLLKKLTTRNGCLYKYVQ